MNLTVVYITSRCKPEFRWFLDSLKSQMQNEDIIHVIMVNSLCRVEGTQFTREPSQLGSLFLAEVQPKPTVWQGKHSLTMNNWWAASNSRNTGICLALPGWVAFCDDRCVLLPGWLDSIQQAMKYKYAVFGSYEKRTGIKVENGVITHSGIVIGEDHREQYVKKHRNSAAPTDAPGEWCFGCTLALPLEWALQVNGFDETCDGLGMEDVIFGLMLANHGLKLGYDYRMKIIEDRTPEDCGPVMVKKDKGVSPNDKSHALLAALRDLKQAKHEWNLRDIRNRILGGREWPIPTGPTVDWYDQQPLEEMG